MAQTSPNTLRYPLGSDSASQLAAYFKNLASDVQAALTVFSDTAPAMTAGLMWYQPTARLLQITDGSAWYPLVRTPEIEHGNASASLLINTSAVTGTVNFPTAFGAVPDVVATIDSNSQGIGVQISSITTTGFAFRVFTTSGGNAGGTQAVTFHWVAAR